MQPTIGRVAFDVAFGIVLPLVCVYFDPCVFQSTIGKPILGSYLIVSCVAIGLGLLSLSTWLLLRRPPALLAGLLVGGAIFAGLLGLVLLPLSFLGLTVLIGVLGFSPFITAFVFCRNAVEAFRQARMLGTTYKIVILVFCGLAISCGGPWVAQSYVAYQTSRALEMVLSHDTAQVAKGMSVLKRFHAFADMDRLVSAFEAENDPECRKRLAETYRELTETSIGDRLAILRD